MVARVVLIAGQGDGEAGRHVCCVVCVGVGVCGCGAVTPSFNDRRVSEVRQTRFFDGPLTTHTHLCSIEWMDGWMGEAKACIAITACV